MSSKDSVDEAQQLGGRLRELRGSHGLTQVALADALGVSLRTIKAYEAGTSTVPSDVLFAMQRAGLDVGHLLGLREAPAVPAWLLTVDVNVLRDVVGWVDEQMVDSESSDPIDRIAWIVREYLETVRADSQDASRTPAIRSQRKTKAA